MSVLGDLARGGFVGDALAKRMRSSVPGALAERVGQLAYDSVEDGEYVKARSETTQRPEGVYRLLRDVEDYLQKCAFRDAQR